MIRYVVVILITNTFCCSSGLPITATYASLGKSLQLLANQCENAFLSTQITNKLTACNISLPTERDITETELECLIFYDINSQLCKALRGSKDDLSQSYNSTIHKSLRVETTCDASKNWKISNLTEYPKYYNTSERVFKATVTCLKACGVEELMSEDTNFFCKYYHWGSELLQVKAISTPLPSNVDNSASRPAVVESTSKAEPRPPAKTSNAPNNDILQAQQSVNEHSQDQQNQAESPNSLSKDNEKGIAIVSPSNSGQLTNVNSVPKPADVNLQTTKHVPIKEKEKKPDDAASADPDDVGEYTDMDDEGLADGQTSNDGNDPGMETDKLGNEKKYQKNPALSSSNGEMPPKEFYSNTMQDTFAEDDDHFFSFFLTAIILVIFLYVLYHNKNKFRKLFLGLLVEGRQPGRRRNSRGHEYRRLDTLEQAMNTNSAAPPSKIIY